MGTRLAWLGLVVCLLAGCSKSAATAPPSCPDNEGGPVGYKCSPSTGPTGGLGGPDGGTLVTPTCPPQCSTSPSGFTRTAGANPIPAENAKAGNPTWRSGRQSYNHQIDVYASTDSAEAGDSISVKVSTDSAQSVTAEIYRLGWYGGAGARKVWDGGPFDANKQADCPHDAATQLVECSWSDTFSFEIGKDWVSGLYLVKIVRPDGFMRFTSFVVRDRRAAELAFEAAFNTYHAYNNWGGEGLYYDGSHSLPTGRAYEVSYDRPFADDDGAGQVLRYEFPMVELLEKNGYDVTYGANMDFSRFQHFLDGIGAFVITGHDEYWAQEERDQVDAAVANGMSLAHFGANGGYWRTRAMTDSAGQPFRTLVCFKQLQGDPIPNSTLRFRDDPVNEPENALWGNMYEDWELIGFPLLVKDASHWLFAGTGLTNGTLLPGLMGYEYDRIIDNGATPAGLEVPISSPAVTAEGWPSRADVVVRTLPGGNLVFAAGSIYWAFGLAPNTELYDERVARMTLNVLEHALAHRRPMKTLPDASNGQMPAPQQPVGCWASNVSAYAGVAGTAANVDGPASGAKFEGPTGLAVNTQGQVFVADAEGNRIRRIDSDAAHTVLTLAGNGDLGLRDGAGAQAMFRRPDGIAIGADGALYVTDSDDHNIRRIENVAPFNVSTFAGGARQAGWVDGPAATARFNRPTAIVADGSGNLFIADQGNNRIRRIDAATHQVTTIAGSGATGYNDASSGLQATFNNPSAIAVAPTGEIYVFDAGNQRVRRISADASHAVTTIAGLAAMPLGFADGAGTEARFRAQMGLLFTPAGDLLVADTANFRIRRLTPGTDASSTQVCTFAGNGAAGVATGGGSVAQITAPTGLALMPDGRVLVTDDYHNLIRVMTR
jgi:sugar lactone lactonase YvrE